jgi:nucleotide-binding universal stress UspA family protein
MNAPPGAIMVGVDGSADSDRAEEWAATAASQRQVALHFVYAIPGRAFSVTYSAADEREHREFAQRVISDAAGFGQPACESARVLSSGRGEGARGPEGTTRRGRNRRVGQVRRPWSPSR